MKRAFLVLQGLMITFICFGADLDVYLSTCFRLNPITGINGDDNEASSKFVQRFLFSPLVFPLLDPYLHDKYPVAPDISLIEKLQYDVLGTGEKWEDYDFLKNDETKEGPNATHFRVKLRNNLKFYYILKGKQTLYDNLNAEDVVFSYRVSRITMDRAYNRYFNEKNEMELGLNTLLYSKIKIFKDVYCEAHENQYVYFKLGINKTCKDFRDLLVYVPILSSKQMASDGIKNSPEQPGYKSIHENMDFAVAFNMINEEKYNEYDIKKLLLDKNGKTTDKGKSFYSKPVGYGQFLFYEGTESGGIRFKDIWESVTFIKNTEWCNFQSGSYKQIGKEPINHDEYRKGHYNKITVSFLYSWDPTKIFKNDEEKNVSIYYNIPLTANMFLDDVILTDNSGKYNKRKMQISHYLYGLYFGPAINDNMNYLPRDVRDFFASLTNRIRIENSAKYITGNIIDSDDFLALIDRTRTENLLSDIEMKKLYYPFYIGGGNKTNIEGSEIEKLYKDMQDNDRFNREYNLIVGKGKDFKEYFIDNMNNKNIRKNIYDLYGGGTEYSKNLMEIIKKNFDKARQHIIANNGEIYIDIFYKTNDSIGETIAIHYREILKKIFKEINITNTIKSIELGVDYSAWQKAALDNKLAKNDKKKKTLSLLVKGWNYKFDLLDDVNPDKQFIDREAFNYIRGDYKKMIDNPDLDIERIFAMIAGKFVEYNVMIPLLGIQNYSIYDKKNFIGFDGLKDIEILLLPYYWRKK